MATREGLQDMPPTRACRPAVVVAVGLALAALAPAAAASGPGLVEPDAYSTSQCAAGRFCVWSGVSFSGSFWSTASVGVLSPSVTVARSVWNRTGSVVSTHSGAGATGSYQCWGAGQQTGSASAPSVSVRTMASGTC